MAIKQVSPEQAAALLDGGWTCVDVRSIPEFDQGHPRGAYNVPLLHKGPAGLVPNGEFMAVMSARFDTSVRLVMSCRSGQRSLRAAEQLMAAGYAEVVNMDGGFAGNAHCPGWQSRGLAVDTAAQPGRTYDELKTPR